MFDFALAAEVTLIHFYLACKLHNVEQSIRGQLAKAQEAVRRRIAINGDAQSSGRYS
ncbi:hypothetical protein [Salinisphaera aquimarina]|uniref:Uncharacterized protein n=1 Tax=Salinisphaera aquimarina TaxID=2094031 RepID=A0ABV7ERH0_9GAMM